MGSVVFSGPLDPLSFLGIGGQPSSPQVVDQRPIVGDVFLTVQGDMSSAAGAEPRSIVHLATTGAAGAVPMVAIIAAVTKDHLFLVLGVFTQLTR